MYNYDLDKEEELLVAAVERGEYVSVKDQAALRNQLMAAVKNSGNKTKNINIRIAERDLHRLKAMAVREGIPYQTLASSILHKSANAI